MSQWRYREARERDEALRATCREYGASPMPLALPSEWAQVCIDRAALLDQVERLRPYLRHKRGCFDELCDTGTCDCGLTDRLREIETEGEG